jgi:hypothetical protein
MIWFSLSVGVGFFKRFHFSGGRANVFGGRQNFSNALDTSNVSLIIICDTILSFLHRRVEALRQVETEE